MLDENCCDSADEESTLPEPREITLPAAQDTGWELSRWWAEIPQRRHRISSTKRECGRLLLERFTGGHGGWEHQIQNSLEDQASPKEIESALELYSKRMLHFNAVPGWTCWCERHGRSRKHLDLRHCDTGNPSCCSLSPHSPQASGTCAKSMEPICCRAFWTQMNTQKYSCDNATHHSFLFCSFMPAKRTQRPSTSRHL